MKKSIHLIEAIFHRFVDFDFFHQKEHSILFHIDNLKKSHEKFGRNFFEDGDHQHDKVFQIHHLKKSHDGNFSSGMTSHEISG